MSQQGRRSFVMFVWMAVGVMLIWRGLPYTGFRVDTDVVGLSGNDRWIAVAVAVVVGIGKGMSALKKAARRSVTRIQAQGDQAPAWKVFSPVSYVLVALMIAAGLTMRKMDYDPDLKAWLVGILYPAIGLALIIGGKLVTSVDPLPPKS